MRPGSTSADLARLKRDEPTPCCGSRWSPRATTAQATVNLRAPLVINPASMRGIQLIAAESRYPIDHPLGPA